METMALNQDGFVLPKLIFLAVILVSCGGGGGAQQSTSPSGTPNLVGINTSAPLDYEEDRLYADVIHTSRDFISGTDPNGTTLASVDGNGWPTTDFSFYVWAGMPKMGGTYTLTFTGQAAVTATPGSTITLNYDPTTNTSSGTLVFPDPSFTTLAADSSYTSLALSFSGTKRTSSSATGTGVTLIKLMRPVEPGASLSFPATQLFNTPLKALVAKFSVVRYMDFLATNGNLQTNWADRPLPTAASFNRDHTNQPYGGYGWEGLGGPWEHVILFANETGKDAWINIPVRATDAYVQNVALLFAYGSDGTNPYTSAQQNPVFPPLDGNLNLYIEFSNELWNTQFNQFDDNCQAASDSLTANGTSSNPLNWDNSWSGDTYVRSSSTNGYTSSWTGANSTADWAMCDRQTTLRTVQISNIFRSVFGDAAMGSRIRVVLMSQLGNAGEALFNETQMMLNYFDNMAGNYVGAAHPPSYYLYGAGGSGYYSPATTVSTLDAFFSDPGFLPAQFGSELQDDARLVSAMGLKRVAYEGGPDLGMLGGARDSIALAAINDPRMVNAIVNMHDAWSNNGGGLFVYYTATGTEADLGTATTADYEWGFTQDVYNLSTQKLFAIDALDSSTRAPITFGTAVPGQMLGGAADSCSSNWSCTSNQFSSNPPSGENVWASYTFNSTSSANWTVHLTFSSTNNPVVSVYVDGALVGTMPTSGGALTFPAGTVGPGLHGVIVKAASGTFSVDSVSVSVN